LRGIAEATLPFVILNNHKNLSVGYDSRAHSPLYLYTSPLVDILNTRTTLSNSLSNTLYLPTLTGKYLSALLQTLI